MSLSVVLDVDCVRSSTASRIPTRNGSGAGYDLCAAKDVLIVPPLHYVLLLAVMCAAYAANVLLPACVVLVLYVVGVLRCTWRVTQIVETGLSVAIPAGYYGRIAERSGWALKGLSVAAGVIDSDFRSVIGVVVRAVGWFPVRVRQHDRIAQLIFEQHGVVTFHERQCLSETARGASGFGSSGR